jgi:thiol-disulfide isomerase/thioredoxin
MKWRAPLKVMAIVGAIATVQILAIVLYRKVEEGRQAPNEAEFSYERLVVRPAPELAFESMDGTARQLRELRGRAVLLHFWATWCPPCREELPGLLALGREQIMAGRLQVVAMSLDADWAPIREFFGDQVPSEVVRDLSGASKTGYDLSTLPDTYLLAADGSVRLRFGGARNWRSPGARRVLLDHLQ